MMGSAAACSRGTDVITTKCVKVSVISSPVDSPTPVTTPLLLHLEPMPNGEISVSMLTAGVLAAVSGKEEKELFEVNIWWGNHGPLPLTMSIVYQEEEWSWELSAIVTRRSPSLPLALYQAGDGRAKRVDLTAKFMGVNENGHITRHDVELATDSRCNGVNGVSADDVLRTVRKMLTDPVRAAKIDTLHFNAFVAKEGMVVPLAIVDQCNNAFCVVMPA
jgi:hypothetical protein